MTVLYNTLLVLLVVLSSIIVFTHKLRIAIILSGTCSMIAALVYLFLSAPDVALAEAVIGSTLSTIILLAGTQKYRVCTVCALPSDSKVEAKLWTSINRCAAKKELEANLVHVRTEEELHEQFYDVGYELSKNNIILFGEEDNYFIQNVFIDLKKEFPNVKITIKSPQARII